IELEIVGKGLTGKGVIPAGPKSVGTLLTVVARPDLPMGPMQFTIMAHGTIDKKRVSVPVSVPAPVAQSMGNLGYPPLAWHNQVALAVKEKAPFALAIKLDGAVAVPGLPANVTITAQRDPGFDEAIELTAPMGLAPGMAPPKLAPIAKD